MSAEIRHISPEEYQAARALWDICFPEDAAGYSAYYFARRTKREYVLAAFEGGSMLSALHAIPYPLDFYGVQKPCAMIAGVATLPQCRHRGLAAALIRQAHEELRMGGVCAAVLKPDMDFYAQFGYLPFAFHQQYRLAPSAAPASCPPLHAPGAGELLSIYHADRPRYAGRMLRTLGDMRAYLEETAVLGGFAASDGAAYALCTPGEVGVEIAELAGYPYDGLLHSLAKEHGGAVFRLPEGAIPPAGAVGLGRIMFSMLCPLEEQALLAGTPAGSVEELVSGGGGKTVNTLEFC